MKFRLLKRAPMNTKRDDWRVLETKVHGWSTTKPMQILGQVVALVTSEKAV